MDSLANELSSSWAALDPSALALPLLYLFHAMPDR